MNAPDKIYVNFPFGETHPWRGPMVTKQGLNRNDTTYIRKDALLEWAKEELGNTSILRSETIEVLQKVIDKLTSM